MSFFTKEITYEGPRRRGWAFEWGNEGEEEGDSKGLSEWLACWSVWGLPAKSLLSWTTTKKSLTSSGGSRGRTMHRHAALSEKGIQWNVALKGSIHLSYGMGLVNALIFLFLLLGRRLFQPQKQICFIERKMIITDFEFQTGNNVSVPVHCPTQPNWK